MTKNDFKYYLQEAPGPGKDALEGLAALIADDARKLHPRV